jgi:hypothetical protein
MAQWSWNELVFVRNGFNKFGWFVNAFGCSCVVSRAVYVPARIEAHRAVLRSHQFAELRYFWQSELVHA